MSDYQGAVSEMQGKQLDYWMYKHAATQLGRDVSTADFEAGYRQGDKQRHDPAQKTIAAVH